jgi:acetolactate synthase-1/3 small subunit
MRQTMACLVDNKPGVLAKVAETFGREKINILSLAAGEIQDPGRSRLTIVVDADETTLRKAEEHLLKIDEVRSLVDFREEELIAMELLLIEINLAPETIPQILQIAELFNAQVIAVSDTAMVLALPASDTRVSGMVRMMKPFGIIEMSRSGTIAVSAP